VVWGEDSKGMSARRALPDHFFLLFVTSGKVIGRGERNITEN